MLKFLTHKLRTHSLNEESVSEKVEERDSGTESDDEAERAEPGDFCTDVIMKWNDVTDIKLSSRSYNQPIQCSENSENSECLKHCFKKCLYERDGRPCCARAELQITSLCKKNRVRVQLLEEQTEEWGGSVGEEEAERGERHALTTLALLGLRPSTVFTEALNYTALFIYFFSFYTMPGMGGEACACAPTPPRLLPEPEPDHLYDHHSSEEELEVINGALRGAGATGAGAGAEGPSAGTGAAESRRRGASSPPPAAPEKRKWPAQPYLDPDNDEHTPRPASSDDDDTKVETPVRFRTSPPLEALKPRRGGAGGCACASGGASGGRAPLSPRRRRLPLPPPRRHRPALDFDKMQQFDSVPSNVHMTRDGAEGGRRRSAVVAGGGRRARRGAVRLLLVMGPPLVGGVSLAGAGADWRADGRAPRPRWVPQVPRPGRAPPAPRGPRRPRRPVAPVSSHERPAPHLYVLVKCL
ncbi:unnamed protein product [Spodoptera littoralis]|uniref:Uncharacterized protein n=1 Tax=Spodoptera littoralis TaxID=7109 RepID=A0A9P0IHN0_SPOLI|nr:unnamed protein product [Spodoptera littoralis]CAH1646385.1 unnamed protein product [Spodoptera littoralis]